MYPTTVLSLDVRCDGDDDDDDDGGGDNYDGDGGSCGDDDCYTPDIEVDYSVEVVGTY